MYYCHLNINCGVVWSPLGDLSNYDFCFKLCFRFLWQVYFASRLQQLVPIDYSGVQHLLHHSAETVIRSTEKGRGLTALTYGFNYTVLTSESSVWISFLRNCSFSLFFFCPLSHIKSDSYLKMYMLICELGLFGIFCVCYLSFCNALTESWKVLFHLFLVSSWNKIFTEALWPFSATHPP